MSQETAPALSTAIEIVKFYRMIDVLLYVGPGQQTEKQSLALSQSGRIELCELYDVPWENKGDIGNLFVFYSAGVGFSDFLRQQVDVIKETIKGLPFTGDLTPRTGEAWEGSEFYGFLHGIAGNSQLAQQFMEVFESGTSEERKAFLEQNLPGDRYDVWQAIDGLFDDPSEDESLELSVNKIFSSASNTFGWC